MAKTPADLLKEAEEAQKELAPELFGEEGKPEPEISEEEKAALAEKERLAQEEADKLAAEEKEKVEGEPKPKEDEKEPPKLEDLQTEIKRLTDELNKEESARGRLRVASEEAQNLKNQIALLQKDVEGLKLAKPAVKEEPKTDPVLQELIDTYGEDSQAVKMYRTMNARIDKLAGDIDTNIKHVEEKVTGVETLTIEAAKDMFYKGLTNSVADWNDIVKKPEFAEFLQQKIPFTNITLYDRLTESAKVLDVAAVAEIYTAFKETIKPAGEVKPTPPVKKGKESLLAPGSTPKGEVASGQPEIFTPDEVKAMSDKIYNLKIKGKVKEAEAIQKKLDAFLDSFGNIAG